MTRLQSVMANVAALIGVVRNFLKAVFLSPLFGGFTAVLGVVAGYLGSYHDKEIFASLFNIYWPTHWFQNEAAHVFDPNSTYFWISVFGFGAGFSGTFWAQNLSSHQTNREIQEALKRLFTMPPKGFLSSYQKLVIFSNEVERGLPVGATLADLQVAIRMQLETMCGVVIAYDNQAKPALFAANVMQFVPSGSSQFAANITTLQTETKCIETGVSIANLAGVLQLQLPLSVDSRPGLAPDSNLRALCLPIPQLGGGTLDEMKLIPGAPLCFASGKPHVYRNQSDLIKKVDENRGFSSTVLSELKDILGAQAHTVQCLICIPLYEYSSVGPGPRLPIGVINIHKDQDDEHIEDKFLVLGPLLAPVVRNLEVLMSMHP